MKLNEFRDPPASCRPILFWVWNGDMKPERMIEQINAMNEQGVKAFFIHPLPPFRRSAFPDCLTIEYLSEEWFEKVKWTVEEAKKRGMKVWLYDEGGWPSGQAFGEVTKNNPEFKGRVLRYDRERRQPIEEVLGRIDKAPVDLLNPLATMKFLETTHEKYKAAVGEEFGKTVQGIFTDEPWYGWPPLVGRTEIPWSPLLRENFRKMKGYDISSYLPILFGDPSGFSEEKIREVKYDFADCVSRLFRDAYFKIIHEWCRRNHLLSVGHNTDDEGFSQGRQHFFRCRKFLDVPGIDAIWRQIFPGLKEEHAPKYVSSAAHVEGKKLCLTESFAVYGWGLTYEEMKWVTDYQYVRGVNMMCPMMFPYSVEDSRLITTCCGLSPEDPRWRHYKVYADYVGRLSYVCRIGNPVINVTVYYPIASIWAGAEKETVATLETLNQRLLENQIDFDYIDDDAILSEECHAQEGLLQVHDMRYSTVIIPSAKIIDIDVLRKLERFCRSGGLLIALDDLPDGPYHAREAEEFNDLMKSIFGSPIRETYSENIVGKGKACFIPKAESGKILEKLKPGVVLAPPNPHIRCCRRKSKTCDIFLLFNEADAMFEMEATFPVVGIPEFWDLEHGAVKPVSDYRVDASRGVTSVRAEMAPYASCVFGFRKAHVAEARQKKPSSLPSITLGGTWRWRILESYEFEAGRILKKKPNMVYEKILNPWSKEISPDFTGTVEYEKAFARPDMCEASELTLDLGEVGHMAEVWLNGELVGSRVWRPYVFDITPYVKAGENSLRIRVTNTLANQMASEDVNQEIERRGWSNSYYKKALPFDRETSIQRSGLMGPVKIIPKAMK